ncbi:RNA-splicing factor [Tulasnella sp. 403]|nr:RNA-splicing factor [Tulasnella sp. 403]
MADTTADTPPTKAPLVPFFKKRTKGRPATARVRDTSPTDGAGPSTTASSTVPSTSEVVIPTKKQSNSLFVQGTSNKRKKPGTAKDDLNEDGGEAESSANPLDVRWSSLGSRARLEAGMQLEAEEAELVEEELRRKRRRDENGGFDPDDDDKPDDGLYKGQKGYQTLIKKRQEVPKAARVGPQRSTNTIRTVTLVDYQPDVCKDYKETGFCGFGDTCKFLHDRGTYLAGWQLDKMAEQASKQGPGDDDSSSEDEEDIPWACFICRKPYTDPVVTRCSHYFCSACAIKRFAKTPKCAACGQPTGGIFNRADKVIGKMKAKEKVDDDAGDDDAEGTGADVEMEGLKNATEDEDEDDGSD